MQFRIFRFDELESSNTEASVKQYRAGDVIVARSQTRGRGQRGNYWHSLAGENLTFSVVAEPVFIPAAQQFLLSEVVSLSVADTLGSFGVEASIKWPNDIYVGDRKIAGILIENDICGTSLSRSIVGIGLNINETGFPTGLPNPVSMVELTGRALDTDTVLSTFLEKFGARYGSLAKGDTGTITADYDSRLYRKGLPSTFRRPGGEDLPGVIDCVRDNGPLVIRHPDGTREEFFFKEIEFVL